MIDVNYVLGKNKRRKTKEAENRPDVIRLTQNEIIKVESNLKDLQESSECAKTYTLLVKQELA